mgnify:CR=1 FL=1
MGIEKVLSDNGITVLSFDEYKQKLNVLGYDINSDYVKRWECSNTWEGEVYYTTGCFFKNTKIGYSNIAIKNNSNLKYDSKGLIDFKMSHAFNLNGKVYVI